MANKRIYYAISQIGFAKDGTQVFIAAHGVQSVGITTTFNLEQVYQLGQMAIYENIEQIPNIEFTAEKVFDGYPLLYHLLTNGATENTLGGRQNIKSIIAMSLFDDTKSAASGTPLAECHMSGMVMSSWSATFPVEGNATESVTAVCNSKRWKDVEGGATAVFTGAFDNTDVPKASGSNAGYAPGMGGVQRREDVMFNAISGSPTTRDVNGATNAYITVLPTDIYGITSSGTNPLNADGTWRVPVQNISISTDLGREEIFQLGRKTPYHRYATFPIEVRTDIEVLAIKYDGIEGDENGGLNGAAAGSNLKDQTIRVQLAEGTRIDLGKKNKLQSIAWNGGDAGQGGGNVTNRYSYVTSNALNVYHPNDPSGLPFVYA